MTNQQLINLLESFMDGQTTVEQETQLADFFRQATDADRPEGISNDDWQAYCEMFRMFENGMEDHTATIRPVGTDASEKKHGGGCLGGCVAGWRTDTLEPYY